jgi:hypothetical protein
MQFYYNGFATLYSIVFPNGYYTLQQLIDTLHILFETATGVSSPVIFTIEGYFIKFEVKATKTLQLIAYTGANLSNIDLYLSLGLTLN